MKNKIEIIILYHSGAGSTKTIAEIFYNKLTSFFSCDIENIYLDYNFDKLSEYDFIIFGFPTYHCEPSESMMDFIKKMPKFPEVKNAFVFTTYGLYTGNTEKIFVKSCKHKNINTCGSNAYKAPATDGVLLFPSMDFMFKYGEEVPNKIKKDINFIKDTLKSDVYKSNYIPRIKLYTILNYPNKLFGKNFTRNISIINNKCIGCEKCVNECIRDCWKKEKDKRVWNSDNCESCFKCVHHCPSSAIILSEKTLNKPKFNNDFYKKIKNDLIQDINRE